MISDFSGVTSDVDLMHLWLKGRPASTVRVYQPVGESFIQWITKKGGLKSCTASAALRWAELQAGKDATRARFVATVKSLLTFAWRVGYAEENVGRVLRCVKVADQLHERIIDEETVAKMIEAAPEGRDRALVRLFYSSGIRISEALTLRWVDVGEGVIHVTGKGKKTRSVRIPQVICNALLALRAEGEEPRARVFKGVGRSTWGDRRARQAIYDIANSIGVKLSPHYFRHAHASHSLDHGAPISLVKESLGHANVATTSKYLHVKPQVGSSQYLTLV